MPSRVVAPDAKWCHGILGGVCYSGRGAISNNVLLWTAYCSGQRAILVGGHILGRPAPSWAMALALGGVASSQWSGLLSLWLLSLWPLSLQSLPE
jgi:hypothetical protein